MEKMMKVLRWISVLGLLLCVHVTAMADDVTDKYQLNTPDDTVQSFFKAGRDGDYVALEKMLSPRVREMIAREKLPMKDYTAAWCAFRVITLHKAVPVDVKDGSGEAASVLMIYLIDETEYHTNVSLIKLNGRWLWNQK
ncbi:MAG: DUF4878 domain-containing protein [Smithellaceae bacterium]